MSFWAATVITNLFSAVPIIGEDLVLWLWSGYSVSGATLTKFFALHFVLPFIITALALFHIYLLHISGSGNPLGADLLLLDSVPFFPYYSAKDLFGVVFYLFIFQLLVIHAPHYLGHPDNYIQANPMVTPSHIVPEWYLLPFYAILRAIPNKLLGVIAMGLSIVFIICLPFLLKSEIRSMRFRPLSKGLFWVFLIVVYQLGLIGGKVAEYPYVEFGQFLTFFYFSYFLILAPLCIYLEKKLWDSI